MKKVDVDKIVRLRNLTITSIEIIEEDMKGKGAGTSAYSYALGKLHSNQDFKSKLNDLIKNAETG